MARTPPLYLGLRLRELRRAQSMTQAEFAARLEISAPYVALLERNERPVTAAILSRVLRNFDITHEALIGDLSAQEDALRALFAQPVLADLGLGRTSAQAIAQGFPQVASALLRLGADWLEGGPAKPRAGVLGDGPDDGMASLDAAMAQAGPALQALDEAASAALATLPAGGLAAALNDGQPLAVRYISRSGMAEEVRRYRPHAREVLIAAGLPASARAHEIAVQFAYGALKAPMDAVRAALGPFPEAFEPLIQRRIADEAALALRLPAPALLSAMTEEGADPFTLAARFDVEIPLLMRRIGALAVQHVPKAPPAMAVLRDNIGAVRWRMGHLPGWPGAMLDCAAWPMAREKAEAVYQLSVADEVSFVGFVASHVPAPSGAGQVKAGFTATLILPRQATRYRHAMAPLPEVPMGPGCGRCLRPDCAVRASVPDGWSAAPDRVVRQYAGVSVDWPS